MRDIALVVLNGAYHSSVGALLDCFALIRNHAEQSMLREGRAQMVTRLRVLSLDGKPVVLSDGRKLDVDGAIDSEAQFAFVWLPAFRAGSRKEMNNRLAKAAPLIPWLKDQAGAGAITGASGTSLLLLIASRLTDSLALPAAPALLPLARRMVSRVRMEADLSIVDSGRLLMASGISYDLSLIIRAMERIMSPEIGQWLRSVVGLGADEIATQTTDPMMVNAQIWLQQHLATSASIGELAAFLSISHSTLARRFHKAFGMTPKAYVQQVRLHSAQQMLLKTDRSIDRIASLVGYSDGRLLRMMFREQTGMTASEWRTHMRPPKERMLRDE
jgi:transcriptional regulator GlxA family with amidase domain